MSTLWTEKYRPKSVETFECPPHLKQFLKTSFSQHLLLYGPPGTGKTTFAHLIASENVLELNASDERGISIVRNKIKTYAMSITKQKTIILDECDNLTSDAQQCLRRVIEDFSANTRFIFITNYLSKIINPLKSRLLKIKFECKRENFKYLKNVGEKENLKVDDFFYKNLFEKCNFDLRRSLNIFQGMAPFIDQNQNVDEFVGLIPQEIIKEFFILKINEIENFVDKFVRSAYSFLQFINQISNEIQLDEKQILFHEELSIFESKAILGCSTEILMLGLCCKKIEFFG
ncbi:replication factor C subunit 4 [Gurleya vavrai]